MKRLFILSVLFVGINLFGQNKQSNDTAIKIDYCSSVYEKTRNTLDSTIVYINGNVVNSELSKCYNPDSMDYTIKKGKFYVNDKQYLSQIDIHLKNNYKLKPISLSELKKRIEVPAKDTPVIFTIYNGITGEYEIINENYDNYLIDENFIAKVVVERIVIRKENIDMLFVSVVTKSKNDTKNILKMRLK